MNGRWALVVVVMFALVVAIGGAGQRGTAAAQESDRLSDGSDFTSPPSTDTDILAPEDGPAAWNVELVGSLDLHADDLAVAGNYAYIIEANTGLDIINVSDPAAPWKVGSFNTVGHAFGVAVAGQYVYIADDWSGLLILDVADPDTPKVVGNYRMPYDAENVAVNGNYAYVATDSGGLRIIDISDPATPAEVGSYEYYWVNYALAVAGNYAYLAGIDYDLTILDVANPARPKLHGTFHQRGNFSLDMTVAGQYAYVINDQPNDPNGGLSIINVANPAAPFEAGYYKTPGYGYSVAVTGNHAYVADFDKGLRIIDVADPSRPAEVGFYESQFAYASVALGSGYIYMADWYGGLKILRFSGAPTTYSISGHVRNETGQGIAGVQVCTQSANCATTNDSGAYSIGNLVAWNYTLTATKPGYFFTPLSQSVTVPPSKSGINFTRTHFCTNVADAGVQPIMFVTGWAGSDNGELMLHQDDQLKYFVDHLAPHGYVTECNAFYASDTSPYLYLIENGEVIQDELCSAYAKVRQWNPNFDGHFSIIGHSYGGLRARAYLESLGDPKRQIYGEPCDDGFIVRVDNLFTMGTPHNGEAGVLPFSTALSSLALWGREWPALKEMLPPKRVMQNAQVRQPRDTRYYFIGGDARLQVLPPTSPLSIAYWKSRPAQVLANDFAVYQVSALGLNMSSKRYPSVFRLTNSDLHGQVPFGLDPLRLLKSYVNPSDTFERQMCSPLHLSGCGTEALDVPNVSGADESVSTMVAELQEPTVSAPQSMTEIAAGELASNGNKVGEFQVQGSGQWQVMLNWINGELDFTLTDPEGYEINPTVADAVSNIDYYQLDTGFGITAAYSFNTTKPGKWAYTIASTGDATPYRLAVLPPLPIEVSTSLPQWSPAGTPVIINALLTYDGATPVVGGNVVARILRPDGQEVTVALYDDGAHHDSSPDDGNFGGAYTPPATGGSFSLMILAEGTYSGRPYQRHATAFFDVAPRSVTLTGSYTDRGLDRNGDGKFEALEVSVGLRVDRPGVYGVAGELYRDATFIGAAYFESALGSGTQWLAFEFSAEDILAAQRNGPYTVRNVMLTDENDVILLVEVADFVHTTAAYTVADFSGITGFTTFAPLILEN